MSNSKFDPILAWSEALRWDDLSQKTQMAAIHTFGNAIGLGVAGTNTETLKLLLELQAGALEGSIPVLGKKFGLGTQASALIHGTAMHVEDFDDTHLSTVLHPGAPIVPVALAIGLPRGVSGRALLEAVAIGVEVASRVGLSLDTTHFDRGWHLTSTVGRVGGAIAGARLAGMTAEDTKRVIALALKSFGGHTEQLGSMCKPLHPGKAAQDMVRLVEAVERGDLSYIDPAEVDAPLGEEFAGVLDWDRVAKDLGTVWELEANAFKPYACGIVSHPIIDVGRQLRDEGVDPSQIASVVIRVNHTVPAVMGVKDPQDGTQSKFSAYHCFCAGLLAGDGGLSEFSTELARRPESVALRAKITLTVDPDMPKQSCHATITYADGNVQEVPIENATGSLAKPMTTADLKRKFLGLTRPYLAEPEAAWDEIIDLPNKKSADEIFAKVSGAGLKG